VKCLSAFIKSQLVETNTILTGDGSFPVCGTCQKSGRICDRETTNPSRNHTLNTVAAGSSSENLGKENWNSESLDPPTPDFPRRALENRRISSIFQHYIKSLAQWYDLNDRLRRFQDIVPQQALDDPLLFSAVLAFSAVQISRLTSQTEFQYISEVYHLESIRRLIAVTNNGEQIYDGATLATTCLLRSYEILAGKLDTLLRIRESREDVIFNPRY
jgi:hypothetical protein